MIPLIRFTDNAKLMGIRMCNGPITRLTAHICTALVLLANVFTTIFQVIQQEPSSAGTGIKAIVYILSGLLVVVYVVVSIWLLLRPMHSTNEADGTIQEKQSLVRVENLESPDQE